MVRRTLEVIVARFQPEDQRLVVRTAIRGSISMLAQDVLEKGLGILHLFDLHRQGIYPIPHELRTRPTGACSSQEYSDLVQTHQAGGLPIADDG